MKKSLLLFAFSFVLLLNVGAQTTATSKATAKPKEGVDIIHLNNDTFKSMVFNYEVEKAWKYNGSMPAIIDFYADWCGPCKMLAPHLEELQKMYKGKIQIYKVNTDQNRELAAAFGIQSLPTIVFVPMGGQPQAAMGYRQLADLESDVKNVLKVTK